MFQYGLLQVAVQSMSYNNNNNYPNYQNYNPNYNNGYNPNNNYPNNYNNNGYNPNYPNNGVAYPQNQPPMNGK